MNDLVRYIPPEKLPDIFAAIEDYLHEDNDPVARYSLEKLGFENVVSVLERVQTGYYSDFFSSGK